jgi:NADPH:quinone reductase-like Zn-dependent oxidoreductase
LRIVGSLLRSRPLEEKSDIVRQFQQRFWPALERGSMAPLIHAVLPITEAEEAHRILNDNENIGKVVLQVR